MNNDPEDDPALFAGKTRLYYGRWNYKYEEAARHGAAGVDHHPHRRRPPAIRGRSCSRAGRGEQFELPGAPASRASKLQDVGDRGRERSASPRSAARISTRCAAPPRSATSTRCRSGVTLSAAIKTSAARRRTANVLGMLPGTDPKLAKRGVVYTAHHDHLGRDATREAKRRRHLQRRARQRVGRGRACSTVAEAIAAVEPRPKRSIAVRRGGRRRAGPARLASTSARTRRAAPGASPPTSTSTGINIWGRTRDVGVIGLGKSTLDDVVVARRRGRRAARSRPTSTPTRAASIAPTSSTSRRSACPAVYLKAGVRHRRPRRAWGRDSAGEVRQGALPPAERSRSTTSWNLDGAVDDVRL